MPRPRQYREWSLSERLPSEISVEQARDILLDCFATVHGPHYAVTKAHFGIVADETTIRRSVKGSLRLAFKHVGGDFDHPTPDALAKVTHHLRDKSLAWGTPTDVVARHHLEITRVLMRVPGAEA